MLDRGHPELLRERYVAELADVAFPVALAHGTAGSSVDVELSVWRAIDGALSERRWQRLRDAPVGTKRAAEREVLAVATEAAYRAALEHGLRGSFLDLELDLWRALQGRRVAG